MPAGSRLADAIVPALSSPAPQPQRLPWILAPQDPSSPKLRTAHIPRDSNAPHLGILFTLESLNLRTPVTAHGHIKPHGPPHFWSFVTSGLPGSPSLWGTTITSTGLLPAGAYIPLETTITPEEVRWGSHHPQLHISSGRLIPSRTPRLQNLCSLRPHSPARSLRPLSAPSIPQSSSPLGFQSLKTPPQYLQTCDTSPSPADSLPPRTTRGPVPSGNLSKIRVQTSHA